VGWRARGAGNSRMPSSPQGWVGAAGAYASAAVRAAAARVPPAPAVPLAAQSAAKAREEARGIRGHLAERRHHRRQCQEGMVWGEQVVV